MISNQISNFKSNSISYISYKNVTEWFTQFWIIHYASSKILAVTAIGEENLLCIEEDSHRDEDILLRELAISILLTAVPRSMPKIRQELDRQYVFAMESSYWQNTYASISPELYLVSKRILLNDMSKTYKCR